MHYDNKNFEYKLKDQKDELSNGNKPCEHGNMHK